VRIANTIASSVSVTPRSRRTQEAALESAAALAADGVVSLATARRAFQLTRGPRKFTVAQVKAALTKSCGLVYLTAKVLKTNADTVNGYLNKYPSLRAYQEQCAGLVNDEAELALFKQARRGAPWAVMYLLKHKARERGYADRTEHLSEQKVTVDVTYAPDALQAQAPPQARIAEPLPPPPVDVVEADAVVFPE